MIRELFLVHDYIEGLPADYNPLDLPPDSKKKVLRRGKVLIEHFISTIRSWKATSMRQESQIVFDLLTSQIALEEMQLEGN